MELIRLAASKRSRWSDALHMLLNVSYAALLFILVSPGIGLTSLAIVLVFLSKWRVFAVRPRFWFANIQANAVDFLVGLSVVALMYLTAVSAPWVAVTLAVLFAGWLVVLKPHSSKKKVLLQAAVTQFVSLTALFSYAHHFQFGSVLTDTTLLTVIGGWVIGYVCVRHALSAFSDETERAFLSLIWGFVIAELAWLYHHWTIAYSIYQQDSGRGDQQLMIPQIAIIVTILSFVVMKVYELLQNPDSKKAASDVRSAVIFGTLVSALLLLFFNGSLDFTSL